MSFDVNGIQISTEGYEEQIDEQDKLQHKIEKYFIFLRQEGDSAIYKRINVPASIMSFAISEDGLPYLKMVKELFDLGIKVEEFMLRIIKTDPTIQRQCEPMQSIRHHKILQSSERRNNTN